MTTLYKQLKSAAASLRKQAAEVEATEIDLQKKASDAASSGEQTKTAAALVKADLAVVAKQAAANIKKAGLLSTDEQADKFASLVTNDHKVALSKLAELATRIPAAKIGSVVAGGGTETPVSADSNWDAKASAHLRRLNIQ